MTKISFQDLKNIDFKKGEVFFLDPKKLPRKIKILNFKNPSKIKKILPTIPFQDGSISGILSLAGIVLSLKKLIKQKPERIIDNFESICEEFEKIQPENFFSKMNIERIKQIFYSQINSVKINEIIKNLENYLKEIIEQSIKTNHQIGQFGKQLIPSGATILSYGDNGLISNIKTGPTFSIIYSAFQKFKNIQVVLCESQSDLNYPKFLAWELENQNIPFQTIPYLQITHFLSSGMIKLILISALRIAQNGDLLAKTGAAALAILAREYNIPFFVAGPANLIDHNSQTEDDLKINKKTTSPNNYFWKAPDLEIIPARYIQAFITEKGIFQDLKQFK